MAYLDSDAPLRGFVGGIGSGKSFVGSYDLLRRARPHTLSLACAPTYPMLRDATLRSFHYVCGLLAIPVSFHKTEHIATLPHGAEILFRSADEPDRLRGSNLARVWMDEASLMARDVLTILLGRLRQGGTAGGLSATFTPRGRAHWTYEVFGRGGPDVACFHSRTDDNLFLPADFTATVARQYTSAQQLQELGGEFVDLAGALFRREWFRLADVAPASLALVRRWDLAATEVKPGRDPDWTAGVLLGRDATNRYHVLDVRRARATPGSVEALVRQTAELDGRAVPVRMEQEPGSAGVALVDHYARNVLAGWDYRGVRSTGDKVVRAGPLAAQAEAGNVFLLRGEWNKAFLDEAETMPHGEHDDQVDAAASALQDLTGTPPAEFVLGTGGRKGAAPAGTFQAERARFRPGVFRG